MKFFHIIIAVLLVLADAVISEKNDLKKETAVKAKVFVFAFLIALYAAIRSPEGMIDDYVSRFYVFKNYSFADVYLSRVGRDPVYNIAVKCVALVFNNAQWLFVIHAILVSTAFGIFTFRRKNDPLLSFLAFFTLRDFSLAMCAMRQGVAIAIIMIFCDWFLVEKKPIKFLLSVIVASLFHTAALAFLLAYPMYHYVKSTKVALIATAVLSFVFRSFPNLMALIVSKISVFAQYESYIIQAYTSTGSQSTLIVYLLFLIFLTILSKEGDGTDQGTLRVFCLGLGLNFLGIEYGAVLRSSYYFTYNIGSLVSYSKEYFKHSNIDRDRKIYRMLLIVIMLAQFIVYGPGQVGLNYSFFWS